MLRHIKTGKYYRHFGGSAFESQEGGMASLPLDEMIEVPDVALGSYAAHITHHDNVLELCRAVKPTHCLVIHDSGDKWEWPSDIAVPNLMTLAFSDFENDVPGAPTQSHADQILQFASDCWMPLDFVVACTYGQSRSAAAALAVTARRNSPWLHYQALKGRICPNMRLVNLLAKSQYFPAHQEDQLIKSALFFNSYNAQGDNHDH